MKTISEVMDCQSSEVLESNEEAILKRSSSDRSSSDRSPSELNADERTLHDIIVLYDYDAEHNNEEYDLAMDGILLSSCSQYLFKFSIIVLPIIFLMVIVIGIFESDQQNNELRCKIGRAFIVLGISVGLLAAYFLCRYGFHIRGLYQESNRTQGFQRNDQNSELGTKSKISKKQLKFILQNPWHRVSESEPKEQYSNHVDIYRENGLYNTSNNTV